MRLLLSILLLFPLSHAICQQTILRFEEIRQLEESGQYFAAIDALEELLTYDETNSEAIYALALDFQKTFQYERALAQFKKIYFLDLDSYPLSEYYFALMSKYTGDYDNSVKYFDLFINRWNDSGRYPSFVEQAAVERAGSRFAMLYSENNKFKIESFEEPLNTEFNDYAPVSINDSLLLITSSRLERKRQTRDQRFGEGFSDQYLFDRNGEYLDETIDILNTKFNDGSGSFCSATGIYYFTICGYKYPYCQIYESNFNGEFSEPQLLPESINLPGFDNKQPGISPSGDSLFFVSNRPGGAGGNDIWFSIRSGNGWGPAQHLGYEINTRLNENTPMPVKDNILIFSSDGHQGYGGMDLFMARRLSNGDTLLTNLGVPFNSSRDDMFPQLNPDTFLWASNRSTGTGFDIYHSEVKSALYFTSIISVQNLDASRRRALGEAREIASLPGPMSAIVNTGDIDFSNLPESDQRMIDLLAIGREGIDISDLRLSQAQIDKLVDERRTLLRRQDEREELLEFKILENEGNYQVTGKLECLYCDDIPTIYLSNEYGERRQLTIADSLGNFRFSHLNSRENMKVEIDSSFQGIVKLENLKVNFIPDYYSVGYVPLYFDLAESEVRNESYIILQELASFLNKNPGFQLEIIAHADNTGSEDYNLLLTRERGQAVFDALLRSGVSPVSMMIRAKGFREPVADNESPLGRQLNRRVEFVLSGSGNRPETNYHYCFTTEALSGTDIIRILDEETIRLNGIKDDQRYRPYLPVIFKSGIEPNSELISCE